MKRIYLIIVLNILFSSWLNAQNYAKFSDTRAIVLNYMDSTIKAHVFIVDEKLKINDELKYYWYNNETIGCNRGGINGKVLHGSYLVINKKGALMQEGQFEKGLKTGKWKYWYPSGEMKKTELWKDGDLHGMQMHFNEKGELIAEVDFKKGIQVQKKDRSFSLNSIFKKKEKEKAEIDSVEIKENDLNVD